MKELHLLQQNEWRIIDQTAVSTRLSALQSFAMDDTLCESVGRGLSVATARAWVHSNTVVLGIQDTKLPHLQAGINFLKKLGYHVIVRNSGGLAVVLDEGILNLSLVLSEHVKRIDINRGYETMLALIRLMFADFPYEIEAREIIGSYCPGSYDLSINGKKFAGISQRRLRNGVAVQIYLAVNCSGSKRAKLIQQFYEHTKSGKKTKILFPQINPNVMGSLSELLAVSLTVSDVMQRFVTILGYQSKTMKEGQLTKIEQELFQGYLKRLIDRNDKVFQNLNKTEASS